MAFKRILLFLAAFSSLLVRSSQPVHTFEELQMRIDSLEKTVREQGAKIDHLMADATGGKQPAEQPSETPERRCNNLSGSMLDASVCSQEISSPPGNLEEAKYSTSATDVPNDYGLDLLSLHGRALATIYDCAVSFPRKYWGSIVDFRQMYDAYFSLARKLYLKKTAGGKSEKFVLCEIGFGPGYSALLFLHALTANAGSASPGGMMYEFSDTLADSMLYEPNAKCALQKIANSSDFSQRFYPLWGKSESTVPQFSANKSAEVCDLIHIDGDHGHEGVLRDIGMMLPLAGPSTRLLFDDLHMGTVRTAVEKYVRDGKLTWDFRVTIDIMANDELLDTSDAYNHGIMASEWKDQYTRNKQFGVLRLSGQKPPK